MASGIFHLTNAQISAITWLHRMTDFSWLWVRRGPHHSWRIQKYISRQHLEMSIWSSRPAAKIIQRINCDNQHCCHKLIWTAANDLTCFHRLNDKIPWSRNSWHKVQKKLSWRFWNEICQSFLFKSQSQKFIPNLLHWSIFFFCHLKMFKWRFRD